MFYFVVLDEFCKNDYKCNKDPVFFSLSWEVKVYKMIVYVMLGKNSC